MIKSTVLRQTASEVTRAWDLVHVLPLDAHGPRFQHFTRLNLVPPTPLGGFIYIYIYIYIYMYMTEEYTGMRACIGIQLRFVKYFYIAELPNWCTDV